MKNELILGMIVGLLSVGCDRQREPSVDRQNPGATTVTGSVTAEQKPVVINGRALTSQQLQDFEKLYRVKPQPGDYWYDANSGLYGAVGQPAAGFMYPGHDLGPLSADASGGTTGVYINGRNQTAQEVQILSYLAQTQVQPGRYWLDAQGNAGYEGNPAPVGNLFAAARALQQQGGRTGGSSGDNFWSTRFSAGNYNADNSAGYVSLPGGGNVSYGF